DDFFVDIEKIKNYSWEKVYLDKEDFEDALTDPRIAILEYKNEPETKLKAQPKTLEEKLKEAEINEDYEKAAKLRDKIKSQPHTKNSSQ
ncbi:MAG: UvrB/UvrC motif-containing protein, partial [Nanoarchaeota archaeon]|nr:UvrB/UvrC motif-containing protein [Nanoarchaeota archaeon]